jgi:hypothetical protein
MPFAKGSNAAIAPPAPRHLMILDAACADEDLSRFRSLKKLAVKVLDVVTPVKNCIKRMTEICYSY